MKIFNKLKFNGKFNPLIMLLYGLVLAAAGYVIVISRAATPSPTIYLTPASKTLPANTTFTVDLRENSLTTPVNAVQANITYPTSLVDFVSIDSSASPFTITAAEVGGNGQIHITRGIIGSLTGDNLVATITFKSKTTSGTAAVTFLSSTSVAAAGTGQNIITAGNAIGGNYTIDNTPPTVNITAPANGAVIAGGGTTTISATANDDSGTISKVEIYIDGGAPKKTLTSGPYNYAWSTGSAFGSHTIQVKAYDPSGNIGTTSITVTVADLTAPTVNLTSPTAGTHGGTITIAANASDNTGGTGMKKVEFYDGATLLSTDTTSPYSYNWNTIGLADGSSHSLTAKAYDNATPANVATSTPVVVTIDNSDHTPPTVPGNFHSTAQTQTSITLAWTASTDNVGVTGYTITRDGSTITTTSSLTYTDNGLTAGTSYNYTIVAKDAAGNSSSPPAATTASTQPINPGDVNGDGLDNYDDLITMLSHFQYNSPGGDCNMNIPPDCIRSQGDIANQLSEHIGDGVIDVNDLTLLLHYYIP